MQEVIQGKYRITDRLGTGGTCCVYRAYDERVGRNVALKMISGDRQEWKRQAAHREMAILAGLDCAGVPRVLDYLEYGGENIIVMDYIEGETLEARIDRQGPMEEHAAMGVAAALLEILEQLHRRGILFLDLKPSNVMITKQGNTKLIDFGSAVHKDDAGEEFGRCGTYGYAAPELLLGEKVDERADIYSFGATLYYILTGISPAKPPYEMQPVTDWNVAVTRKTQQILEGCLGKEKGARYCDLSELREACRRETHLRKVWKGGTAPAKSSLSETVIRYVRKRKKVLLKQEKNIYCSMKRGSGLSGMLLPALFAAGVLSAGMQSIDSQAARNPLFMNVRDEIGQKLLIQEGAIYYTKESMIFEIPAKEFQPETEYEIKIISTDTQDGQARERTFRVVRQDALR